MDLPALCLTPGLQSVAEEARGGAAVAGRGAHQSPALLCGICPGIDLLGDLGPAPLSRSLLGMSLEVWGMQERNWEMRPKLEYESWSGRASCPELLTWGL